MSVDQTLSKAKRHAKRGETLLAEQNFKIVLEKFPKNRRAIEGLEALKQAKIATNANPPEKKTTEQQAPSIQQLIDSGVHHHTAGRLAEAEGIYKQVLMEYPNEPSALHLLGLIAHQVGKSAIAIDLIGKALRVKPDYADAHNSLGVALKAQDKLDEAVASYRSALTINPTHADAYNNLGCALMELDRFDEAASSFSEAIALIPEYADAHYNLGNVLKLQGKFSDAVASYSNALTIRPDFAEAYISCGYARESLAGEEPEKVQVILARCLAEVSSDNLNKALEIGQDLCLKHPNYAQQCVKSLLESLCKKINRMLDKHQLQKASERLNWLYTHTNDHSFIDVLINRFIEETIDQEFILALSGYEKAVYLSMKSHSLFKKGQYEDADECAKQCMSLSNEILEIPTRRADGWKLMQNSMRHIRDKAEARIILEQILLSCKR